ncbi:Di-copper centre-containing protein [Xylaria cf. heliscus]|nr:Di-copper centre-containing protein [Xylaria cf. heliscus]
MLLLEARAYVLCLAIATKIGHADAQTGPVAVVGMTTGIDQATGKLPLRMNINTLEQDGGPMWYNALLRSPGSAVKTLTQNIGIFSFSVSTRYRTNQKMMSDLISLWRAYMACLTPLIMASDPFLEVHGEDISPQLIPWHRAYLVFYEQSLGNEVQRLALQYTNDDAPAYLEASQKLRFPYWDWASDPTLPSSSTQENITVNGPNGQINLHNPLYSYRWQTYPLNETQFPGQGEIGPETTRHEDGSDMTNFIKDSVVSISGKPQFENGSLTLSEYRTFSSATTYDQMASMAGSGSSFESPHNAIHNSVGGSFLSLDLTSFDALFMLHHCNLDRLSAMWTASHHDTLQTQPFTSQGLYSTAKGEIITADSPLKPFYQADGRTFHTGRTVATTEAFGYTYPDIPGDNQGRKEVIVQINRLYGDLSATKTREVASTSRREWFVELQVDRADLPLPCNIDVYLGGRLAGRTSLLSMPKTGIAHDELVLSRAIRSLDVDENEPGGIERRIMNDLHVKVTKGGTTLDPGDIPSLHINVVGEDVTLPSSESEFPSYSNRTTTTVIFVPSLLVLPADIGEHAKPDISMDRPQTCPELFKKCLGPRGMIDKKVVKWNEGMCNECWDRFLDEAREMAEAAEAQAEADSQRSNSDKSRYT